MKEIITTHSARVKEILRHMQKQRQREAQDRAWRRLQQKGVGITRGPIPYAQPVAGSKFLYDLLPDDAWAGRRCFIIGGGLSLKGFDFSSLQGELVIGINRAFEFCDCDIFLAIDAQVHTDIMLGEFGEAAKTRFENFEGYKVWLDRTVPNVLYLRNYGADGLTTALKDGLATGGNTGYAALNLAICLGASPIYLLGFDMKGDGKGGQAWFHDGYRTKQKENVYDKFKTHFEIIAPEVARRGFKVVNLNPSSKLKCFPFGLIDDIKDLGNPSVYFDGCLGFGDNFEQRPLIRKLAQRFKTVYVRTAFPEAYWDIPNLKFVKPEFINLRTQKKHMSEISDRLWTKPTRGIETIGWRQCWPREMAGEPVNIARHIRDANGIQDYDFGFPVRRAWLDEARKVIASLDLKGKKLCIIRQPTQRREWNCPARNPKTEYFQLLIDRHKDEYFFLNVADVAESDEGFDTALTGIDAERIHGELSVTTIFGLMRLADMTITFPGFLMPAAIALRARAFVIFGGHAAPAMHIDPIMGLQNFGYVAPDPPCHCLDADHGCKKDIPEERVLAAFADVKARPRIEKTVTVGVPPGLGDVHWILTKMESFKEKNGIDKLRVAVCNGGLHKYTSQYLELVPFIDEVENREQHFQIGIFYGSKPFSLIRNYQGADYLIDFGAEMFLRGRTISQILPEYEPHYDFEIRNPEEARKYAADLKARNPAGLVLFYTSAIGNNANWNRDSWTFGNWMTLAERIHGASGARPILIGAHWDRDYSTELKRLDKNNILQDMTGTTDIPRALALIREAQLLVGFPCGLPILSVYLGKPTVMFWPIKEVSAIGRFHKDFMHTWVPPAVNGSGRYIPLPYGGPDTNPEWIFEHVRKFL
jgi:hypothetical protein